MSADSMSASSLNRVAFSSNGCRLFLDYQPVFILTLGANGTRDDYAGLLAAVDRHVIATREPYIILTDTRGSASAPSADVRRLISDWMKKNDLGNTSLGSVTIISSAVIRGALTALYWLFEPKSPQAIVGTWDEARDWSVEKLRAARIPPPPKLVSARYQPY
jgi:hypothetical protein